MFYKILVLLLTLLLSSCSMKNLCQEEEIYFVENMSSFKHICNYKEKLKDRILRDNGLNIENFYFLSKNDIEAWKYILWYIDKNNVTHIQKIQLYSILKNMYDYSDEKIESKIWFIEPKYKNLWVSIERIIWAENLLTQVFEWQEETMDWVWRDATWYLTYEELEFLYIVFTFEPERFNSINLVSDLSWWYRTLVDEKSKKLYKDMMKYVWNNVESEISKEMVSNFFQKN